MSKFTGLDKINVNGLIFVGNYSGSKIYNCPDDLHPDVSEGFLVVCRGYMVDCQICSFVDAKLVIDHFNMQNK